MYFSRCFRKQVKLSPSEYRKKHSYIATKHLALSVVGSDCGTVSFGKGIDLNNANFFTHGINPVPSPATGVLSLDTTKNLEEINCGSFWAVQKPAQHSSGETVATLFWLLSDESMQDDIRGIIGKKGQTWSGLVKALSDKKWGDSGRQFQKLFRKKFEN